MKRQSKQQKQQKLQQQQKRRNGSERSVAFLSSVTVTEIPNLSYYKKNDITRLWYTKQEYDAMSTWNKRYFSNKNPSQLRSASCDEGEQEQEDTYGMYTSTLERRLRKEYVQETIYAVLLEQEEQWEEGNLVECCIDEKQLAKVYIQYTLQSRLDAMKNAMKLHKELVLQQQQEESEPVEDEEERITEVKPNVYVLQDQPPTLPPRNYYNEDSSSSSSSRVQQRQQQKEGKENVQTQGGSSSSSRIERKRRTPTIMDRLQVIVEGKHPRKDVL